MREQFARNVSIPKIRKGRERREGNNGRFYVLLTVGIKLSSSWKCSSVLHTSKIPKMSEVTKARLSISVVRFLIYKVIGIIFGWLS